MPHILQTYHGSDVVSNTHYNEFLTSITFIETDNKHFQSIPVTEFRHWVYYGLKGCRQITSILRHEWLNLVLNKLLEQGYVKERLKSSLRKFYGRYGDLIKQYEVFLSQMLNDILWPGHIQ